MTSPISDLAAILSTLEPVLNHGVYAYALVPPDAAMPSINAIGMFREPEGITLIAPEADVVATGLPVLFRAAWITLKAHSSLQAIGLTAAFSRALGDAGISCNVVAAACHDHLFVPIEQAERAMVCLRGLQKAVR